MFCKMHCHAVTIMLENETRIAVILKLGCCLVCVQTIENTLITRMPKPFSSGLKSHIYRTFFEVSFFSASLKIFVDFQIAR